MASKFDGYDGSDWVQELIEHPRNANKNLSLNKDLK